MAIHIVQKGESLWSISENYHVSIQTIVSINKLAPESGLIPGLALYLPDNRLPIRSKLISSGDTFWSLASQYQTSTSLILAANPDIDPNNLYIGQKINIPSPLKLTMQTLGFIVPFSQETFIPILNQLASQLTYLAIVSYSFTNEGYAYLELADDQLIVESKRLNLIPLLMIRNFQNGEFSPELIGNVLANPTYRKNLINSLRNFVIGKGYGGVSIDFEFIPPQRRNNFTIFLNELKAELKPLILHVNVHAKTEDNPTNRIVGGYDYQAIGMAADIVAVMTIDYGYPTGPPNPVAPIWWIEEVIKYSIGLINPRKLQISMPLYGYDWRLSDNRTKAYSLLAAQNLALSSGTIIQFDSNAATPWYTYWEGSNEHIVWFDDIRSFQKKYQLIDQYNLLGTTYWQLSLPFPQNWAFVAQNFTIV